MLLSFNTTYVHLLIREVFSLPLGVLFCLSKAKFGFLSYRILVTEMAELVRWGMLGKF